MPKVVSVVIEFQVLVAAKLAINKNVVLSSLDMVFHRSVSGAVEPIKEETISVLARLLYISRLGLTCSVSFTTHHATPRL